MRIFEDREDEALKLDREEQVPLAKQPDAPQHTFNLTTAQKEAFPLETFPLIEDFEVALLPWPDWISSSSWRKQWGYHFAFFSQQQGLLACFGLRGHALLDYEQEAFRIPLNFWDFAQAFEQLIFEEGLYVYFLESDVDDYTAGYHCWFRVSKDRYLMEWQLALEALRRIIRQSKEK